MNPLVSIIIPTYNRVRLIEATLNSILAQTYTLWECLVIDDGSTDGTENLVHTFIQKDDRFKYYKRPHNLPKGANACRNYGFDLSKGSLINWFDSDDIMLPKKLEMQAKVLSEQKDFPYCICQTKWIDKTTNKFLGLRANKISSDNRFEDYILHNIFWSILAPVWRRTFLIQHDLKFDETLHQSQEYDFHIKALANNDNYIVMDVALAVMYKHKDNLSANIYSNSNKVVSNLRVKKLIFERFSNKISNRGKIKLYESLTLMFKELLILKHFKLARKCMLVLINALKYIKLSFIKKYFFVFKLLIIFLSYRIFGVGYKLIKPLE